MGFAPTIVVVLLIAAAYVLGRRPWLPGPEPVKEPVNTEPEPTLRSEGPRQWCPACGVNAAAKIIVDDKKVDAIDVTFVHNKDGESPYIRSECSACGAEWADDVAENADWAVYSAEDHNG